MTPEHSVLNQRILEQVELHGGGYVWDAEVFAVTLMDTVVQDGFAAQLCGLYGIQQIALDASELSYSAVKALASIPGLQSLVLNHSTLTEPQRREVRQLSPEVVEVDE